MIDNRHPPPEALEPPRHIQKSIARRPDKVGPDQRIESTIENVKRLDRILDSGHESKLTAGSDKKTKQRK